MGYRNVDPSIPDKIISMSERRLDAEVDNRKRLTIADALSVAFASIGTTILPWIVCIVGIVYGQNAAAILGGAAGVVTVGSTIIRSIREAKNNDSNDME